MGIKPQYGYRISDRDWVFIFHVKSDFVVAHPRDWSSLKHLLFLTRLVRP